MVPSRSGIFRGMDHWKLVLEVDLEHMAKCYRPRSFSNNIKLLKSYQRECENDPSSVNVWFTESRKRKFLIYYV